ncbi:unnamed protein product [Mucor fragilis]
MSHALPEKNPSSTCPLCPDAEYHTAEHMLIRCPRVWQIWKPSFLYTCPQDRNITCLSPRQLITALYSLRNSPSTLSPLHVTYLFGSILESIWRHYWLYTIDEVPFVPLTVVVSTVWLFRQYTASASIGPMQLSNG